MNAARQNPFETYAAAGYRWMCPIMPPGCNAHQPKGRDNRGKAPGVLGDDGYWLTPKGWNARPATPEDMRRWHEMGAGVGFVGREGLAGFDADILDERLAEIVKTEVLATLGQTPIRIGRYPKRLYVFRTDPEFGAKVYPFGGAQPGLIEIVAGGKQFVVHGLHQTTNQPYRWEESYPLVPFDELPFIEPAALIELINRVLAKLPEPGKVAALSAPTVGAKRIKGDLGLITAAMSAIPNVFAERSAYINVGYALKSALSDHPEEAWALWEKWCEDWDGENAPETIEADWRSFGASVSLGCDYLFGLAKRMSKNKVDLYGASWWEPVAGAIDASLAPVPASSFAGLPAPKQEWLVKDLIPARNVTMLSGDGATGKSLVMLQLGASIASGTDWLGVGVKSGRVLFLTAEDEMKELHRRIEAIERGNGAHAREKLSDLFVMSLNGLDAVMAAPAGKDGLLKPTDVFGRVKGWIAQVRPVLTVLDTQADLFGGDENKRIHARQFIGMLQGLVNEFDMTVVLVSHPSMSGMASGSGMSGNTAWNNSVRSRLYFERRFSGQNDKEEKDPDIRLLTSKKANRARVGVKYVLRYVDGIFVREGLEEDSASADRNRETEALFLRILGQRNAQKRNVSHLLTVKDYAPRVCSQHPLGDGVSLDQFEAAMERLFAAGALEIEEFGPPSHRRKRIVAKVGEEPPKGFFD